MLLLAQRPQAVIVRTFPAMLSADGTYDNSSWQNTVTHVAKTGGIERRAALAKVTSPTQADVKIVCDIDLFRGGDVVYLKLFGPMDGLWLVGTATRSIFQPYTDLALVQGMAPLNALTGMAVGPLYETGKSASAPGSGTVMAAMLSEAQTISKDNYPYKWGGGHTRAGYPNAGRPGGPAGSDGPPAGFDCSGAVAAVLAAGGLWKYGSSVPGDADVIQQLRSNDLIVPGQGSGRPECTIWDNPGVHIFMRLNGTFWGTSDGQGPPESQPAGGPGWLYDQHLDASSHCSRRHP